jgi:general secretion pathway protein K
VLVAIATVLAVHVGTRAALDIRRTSGLAALDQGWHVALGAEAWAAEVLRKDVEDSQVQIDHLGEAWAQPLPPLPIDGGAVRGALEDMQGRFNLNSLVNSDREADEASIERFQRLLVLIGAQPRWARVMADWLDGDTIEQLEGAEDGTYLSQSPPYRTANRLISTTTEMMALPGMTREEFERIRPYVAALPRYVKVNVCTAKAPVLAAIIQGGTDFSDPELLAANRRDGCYPTMEFLKAPLNPAERQALATIADEKSDWFRAVTAVRIGTSEFTLYSLIERNGNAIRTILRATGTE